MVCKIHVDFFKMSGINTDKSLQLLSGKFIEYCLLTSTSTNIQLLVPLGHNTTTASLQ